MVHNTSSRLTINLIQLFAFPFLFIIDIEKHAIYVLQITLPNDCRENEHAFAGLFVCFSRLLHISLYILYLVSWFPVEIIHRSHQELWRNFGIIQLDAKCLLIRSWPIGLDVFDDEALFEEVVYALIGYETEIVEMNWHGQSIAKLALCFLTVQSVIWPIFLLAC